MLKKIFYFSIKESESRLEQANRDYHDMHASFTAKRLSNRHYLYGLQDTVVDQTLQLNRILRLLNEDDYLNYDIKNLSLGHSRTSYTPRFGSTGTSSGHYNPNYAEVLIFQVLMKINLLINKTNSHNRNDILTLTHTNQNYRKHKINTIK